MSWSCYQLTYRLEAPLHVGFHEAGYIQRTRKYVPGRAMWGAITARLTRLVYSDAEAQAYHEIGKEVNENLIPGYFFLGDPEPLLPQFTEERGLVFAHPGQEVVAALTEAEFERRFLCSFTQTSIRGKTQTAEEESLHEMEFLVDRYKPAKETGLQRVYLIGHLFLKDGTVIGTSANGSTSVGITSADDLEKLLGELSIGGERAYGSGRITLQDVVKTDDVFRWKLIGGDSKPILHLSATGFLRAHARRDCQKIRAGDLERFAYRSWNADAKNGGLGPGRWVEDSGACWVPGSITDAGATFTTSSYGIWQPNGGAKHA